MLWALIIAATAGALTLAALAVAVVTGWFPPLAALSARALELLLWGGGPTRLDPRQRSELIARLWVP